MLHQHPGLHLAPWIARLIHAHVTTWQVTAKVVADGQAFKPQQVFLALKHVGSGVSAYMVGKVKKGNTFEIMATAALIERQIGKLVSDRGGGWRLRGQG